VALCVAQEVTITSTLRSLINRALWPVLDHLDRAEARDDAHAAATERRLEQLQAAIGRLEAQQLGAGAPAGGPLAAHEFRAFSQWVEDGISQWLVREVEVGPKVFVEFGVEDYREANTRFLAERDNWTGLVMDGSQENIERVRRSEICWRQNLRAVAAFITCDNVNQLISGHGISGEIGLLSIDIDGNDYWVWKALDVVRPVIAVAEYNHRFGDELAVTIPYDAQFRRGGRYPIYYFGASLKALCLLGARKGYAFVGCNSHGVNAFFVRRDRLPGGVREMTVAEGYVAGGTTETSDELGLYVPASPERERLDLMRLPLVAVSENADGGKSLNPSTAGVVKKRCRPFWMPVEGYWSSITGATGRWCAEQIC
jgi:hypothetical protein